MAEQLTGKQAAFVAHYLASGPDRWNQTRAAEKAGYSAPAVRGSELVRNRKVRAAIDRELSEITATGEEILERLWTIATDPNGYLGQMPSVAERKAALVDLGKAHSLFTDKVELNVWQAEIEQMGLSPGELFEALIADVIMPRLEAAEDE